MDQKIKYNIALQSDKMDATRQFCRWAQRYTVRPRNENFQVWCIWARRSHCENRKRLAGILFGPGRKTPPCKRYHNTFEHWGIWNGSIPGWLVSRVGHRSKQRRQPSRLNQHRKLIFRKDHENESSRETATSGCSRTSVSCACFGRWCGALACILHEGCSPACNL